MDGARSTDRGIGGSSGSDTLRKLLFDLPGSSGSDLSREMGDIEDIRSRAANGSLSELSPQELHATLWKVLTFRDNVRPPLSSRLARLRKARGLAELTLAVRALRPQVVKGIENTIEKIPGLSALTEKITNSVNAFVFTTIEPMIKPIMGESSSSSSSSKKLPRSIADSALTLRAQVRPPRSSRRARPPSSTTLSRCVPSATRSRSSTTDSPSVRAVRGLLQPARERPEPLVPQQGPVRPRSLSLCVLLCD